MKYSQWIGILAAIGLIVSSFLPWAFYPDINQTFTGFYTFENVYGKPGKALIFFAVVSIILYLVPKIWAKRVNLFLLALGVAYGVKTYAMYSGCYRGVCPTTLYGIWLMLIFFLVMLLCAIFPSGKLKQ